MSRFIAPIFALAMLTVSPLQGQRVAAYRGGVTLSARDSVKPHNNVFAPPTAQRFSVSAGYIGLTAALGAAAGAVSFSSHECPGCALGGATFGSIMGTGVGNRLAADALRCDRWNASVRTGFATFLVGSIALMIGKSNASAGEWTAIAGTPLASAYFVSGCDPR